MGGYLAGESAHLGGHKLHAIAPVPTGDFTACETVIASPNPSNAVGLGQIVNSAFPKAFAHTSTIPR